MTPATPERVEFENKRFRRLADLAEAKALEQQATVEAVRQQALEQRVDGLAQNAGGNIKAAFKLMLEELDLVVGLKKDLER